MQIKVYNFVFKNKRYLWGFNNYCRGAACLHPYFMFNTRQKDKKFGRSPALQGRRGSRLPSSRSSPALRDRTGLRPPSTWLTQKIKIFIMV